MTHNIEELLVIANQFEKIAEDKLDPKAKVRNRGIVCVPASSAKDKQDHFPIDSIDQARNALARVHQYSKVPSWYNGSLKGLQDLVSRKVHSKYPAIGKEKKKSSALEILMVKYADANALANILRTYEDGASCVKAFIEAMNIVAQAYAEGQNLDDYKTRKVYELYLEEASKIEELGIDLLPEIERIDREIENIQSGGEPTEPSDEPEQP